MHRAWGLSLTGLALTCSLLWIGAGRPLARAQETAPQSKLPETVEVPPEKAETAKVEKGSLSSKVELKGVFEPKETTELTIRPESWSSPLIVETVVPHGAEVKKGDVVLQLDLEKIDQSIKELRMEKSIADLSLKEAEEELEAMEKNLPLDLAAAERAKTQAIDDLERFLEIGKPQSEHNAEFSVKSAQESLAYAKEELGQLQQMYKADDLTEETEEIILRRQKFQVESSEFRLKNAELQREQTLKVSLPRQEESLRENAEKQTIALEKTLTTLPMSVSQKRLSLNKARYESEKTNDKLADLETDREAMTVRAPVDGVVYYGHSDHGKWTTAQMEAKLRRGGTVAPHDAFITIVSARPVFVLATVEEKDLHKLREGMTGNVSPTGFPSLKIPARLASVSRIPTSAGTFEATIEVDMTDKAQRIMPGMSCEILLTEFERKDVLTLPFSAVFEEDDDHYVYLMKNGEPEKTPVKVGKTADGKTEIVEGLDQGDEVRTSKP